MVSSVHELASQAGVEILKKGGNAVDAGVATGLALTVVYPYAGNLGGGGFMMIHLADGRDVAIDYRETAPAAASRDMYVGADGKVLPPGPGSSTVGWHASGIPGSVAGFALAQQKYGSGKVTWADVCEPARRLAAEGFVVSQFTADLFHQAAKHLGQFPESKRVFLGRRRLPCRGRTLAASPSWPRPSRGCKKRPARILRGRNRPADRRRHGEKRRQHHARRPEGLHGRRAHSSAAAYRGYDVVTVPPPSSGGIALLQMLGMLEPYDFGKLGYNSAAKYHLFHEVMRRAFRDRAEYLGDPDFVHVPVAGLLDRGYIAGLMKNYDPAKATPSDGLAPGIPAGLAPGESGGSGLGTPKPYLNPLFAESTETTHFSIVDAAGNAISNTYTLNGAFGSGVTIPGAGLLMNNEMDDFSSKVGVKNMFGLLQGPANSIAPGKRPLSSMTPTFVLKDGAVVLVTGSPGGPTIINTVLEIITNFLDHGMPVMQAVEAPRFHHQWQPDVVSYDRFGMSPDTTAILIAEGHVLKERENVISGDGETIAIDPKTHLRLGASDPRKPDAKSVGY